VVIWRAGLHLADWDISANARRRISDAPNWQVGSFRNVCMKCAYQSGHLQIMSYPS